MTGGLWPAELSTVTAQTAPLVKYLKADLQRIVNSANEELARIGRSGMTDSKRQAEEARVINGARAFAVRRVESTVRHLRKLPQEVLTDRRPVNGAREDEPTRRLAAVTVAPPDTTPSAGNSSPPPADTAKQGAEPIAAAEPAAPAAQAETAGPKRSDSDDTEVFEEVATIFQEIASITEAPVDQRPAPLVEPEPDREQLERHLKFVARQEPGLRWAIGTCENGTTLLVTDLAHGWIPSGITLPAGVRLLEPQRRTGNAAALLGKTTISATYVPGDPLGWASDDDMTDTSLQPRELPPVDDLGWGLSDATHWRDGLPRMVHTLAKAGAAGTGVVEAEIELLRVHLDTARYQLLAQYPDVDTALLLNCLLLAATEGIASGDLVTANYHFAWFQMLNAPPADSWKAN